MKIPASFQIEIDKIREYRDAKEKLVKAYAPEELPRNFRDLLPHGKDLQQIIDRLTKFANENKTTVKYLVNADKKKK